MSTTETLVPKVRKIATGFYPKLYKTCDREDMIQEGFVGLMEARERYEPGQGASKSTWCSLRARGAMHDHVRTMARKSREMCMGGMNVYATADGL
ncbi:MAG: hypothetical protein GXP54_07135, partial [Deltaproteobacteria bacterium]|nr:hypothetical protein [Deltaproteobacteria bacterium]